MIAAPAPLVLARPDELPVEVDEGVTKHGTNRIPVADRLAWTFAETAEFCGISPSHLNRMLKDGTFGPQPVRLGSLRRFRADEVRRWFSLGCPDAVTFAAIVAAIESRKNGSRRTANR